MCMVVRNFIHNHKIPAIELQSLKKYAKSTQPRVIASIKIHHTEGPRFTRILDLEKNVLHEIRASGTVLWSPTNAKSPTCTYISQKPC